METNALIGERLRLERERLGYSQSEFAALAGAGRKSQFNYESGERSPDAVYFAALADAGADVQFIITGVKGGVVLLPGEWSLIAHFRACNDSGKRAIEATASVLAGQAPDAAVSTDLNNGQQAESGTDVTFDVSFPQQSSRLMMMQTQN